MRHSKILQAALYLHLQERVRHLQVGIQHSRIRLRHLRARIQLHRAIENLRARAIPDAELDHQRDLEIYRMRHLVVTELCAQHKVKPAKAFEYLSAGDMRGVPDDIRPAVAEARARLVNAKAFATWTTIRDSYYLIKRAGGARATLGNYLEEVRRHTEARRRRRPRKRRKFL
jgi:hypothetical protein